MRSTASGSLSMTDPRGAFRGSDNWITMFADASFCHETKAMGWCCWIKYGHPAETAVIDGAGISEGSTQAEVAAINSGLDFLDSFPDEWLENKFLTVQSDSRDALRAVQARLDTMYRERRMRRAYTKHVRGHQGSINARSYINELCDRKAKDQMRAKRVLIQKNGQTCS